MEKMVQYEVHSFISFTLAIMLLFIGKALTLRYEVLRRYSIPEPVIGGFACAAVVALLYFAFDVRLSFDLQIRDYLLLYFFAALGLKSDLASLRRGGKPLAILLALASVFIVLQNLLGMGMAAGFGLNPKAGLMVGSVALTGGVGTTLAWAPIFSQSLGIGNALELGIASNTVGLIAACVIGGPLAHHLIRRHRLTPSADTALEVGTVYAQNHATLCYYDVLWVWMWLNLALMLGYGFNLGFVAAGVTLPPFVSCLIAGILIRNLGMWLLARRGQSAEPSSGLSLALISDICLGMFLTMALMGMQLWELHGSVLFVLSTLCLQVLLTIGFALWVVFRCMGGDYEASVIAAGFGGIGLGSTATAIVNMSAVTQRYGAAHLAFLIVPLVCGFFIDIVNALIIGAMAGV